MLGGAGFCPPTVSLSEAILPDLWASTWQIASVRWGDLWMKCMWSANKREYKML